MADEVEDEEVVVNDEKPDRALTRNKDLSDKLAAEAKKREKVEAESEANKKEAEFYKTFNTSSSKYQGAAEFQDKIKELVVTKGYDMEDAMVAVLNKEGKFIPTQTERRESPAGGSAVSNLPAGGDKSIDEMSLAEKRKQLLENDAELRNIISPKLRL